MCEEREKDIVEEKEVYETPYIEIVEILRVDIISSE